VSTRQRFLANFSSLVASLWIISPNGAWCADPRIPTFLGAYIHLPHVLDANSEPAQQKIAIEKLLDRMKALGLNSAVPYATTSSGAANYASGILPARMYPDWDPLEHFATACRQRGLTFYPAVCVLVCGHQQPAGILREHPEWALADKGGRELGFISPGHPDAREWIVSMLAEIVHKYHPDGLLLDYVRYPNRPVQLDAVSAARFASSREKQEGASGIEFGSAHNQAQPSASNDHLQAFKEQCLTELVEMFSQRLRHMQPGIQIGIYSWGPHVIENHAVGQDWRTWARRNWIDMVNISGYCYPANYGDAYLDVFKKRLSGAAEVIRSSGARTRVTFALGVKTSHGQIRAATEIQEYLRIAKATGAQGVAVFTWSYLEPFLDDVEAGAYFRDVGIRLKGSPMVRVKHTLPR
jgi:uncharacterized lipoprotein YddW (UPF0748 family)